MFIHKVLIVTNIQDCKRVKTPIISFSILYKNLNSATDKKLKKLYES